MTISSFDPFSTFDRMLSRLSSTGAAASLMSLPMDVYRKGEQFVVELDVPGVDSSSIDINVERNMLTVSGEVHARHEDVDELLVCERPHARFRRQVYLGENLDTENIEASYANGVLTITIPMSPRQQARRIEIRGASRSNQPVDVQSGERSESGDAASRTPVQDGGERDGGGTSTS
jgi:HSP20 family protein